MFSRRFEIFDRDVSVAHNTIGAATKRLAPSQKPRIIHYRSFKGFAEPEFLYYIACAPFHVMEIFDDVDDMAWYTSALIRSIIDEHAPMKSKVVTEYGQKHIQEMRETLLGRKSPHKKSSR